MFRFEVWEWRMQIAEKMFLPNIFWLSIYLWSVKLFEFIIRRSFMKRELGSMIRD